MAFPELKRTIEGKEGILPVQLLRQAVDEGIIHSGEYNISDARFQPASLDLTLGETAHRLRSSFLPEKGTVREKLDTFSMGEIDIHRGGILEVNRPYLIPLREELRLPQWLRAKANPKSSTGRVDVFTRVITDGNEKFDEIRAGYQGKLYLEVVPRSFTIKVSEGLSLNQLRLIAGNPSCDDKYLRTLHSDTPLLYERSRDNEIRPLTRLPANDGVFLSVDLRGTDKGIVGYKAKKNSRLLDLTAQNHNSPDDFWDRLNPEVSFKGGQYLVLEPEEFYLLISSERCSIPPQVAAEMTAFDPTSGELRTHYAGFFDPGFGYEATGLLRGTRAVMEIRAHDVPFVVEHQQRICKLRFEQMIEPPIRLYGTTEAGSSYQSQEQMLSKHFFVGESRQKKLFDFVN